MAHTSPHTITIDVSYQVEGTITIPIPDHIERLLGTNSIDDDGIFEWLDSIEPEFPLPEDGDYVKDSYSIDGFHIHANRLSA